MEGRRGVKRDKHTEPGPQYWSKFIRGASRWQSGFRFRKVSGFSDCAFVCVLCEDLM